MATRTSEFFETGSSKQFEWVLAKYDTALQLKAENKTSKAETLLKLDKWYQNELPKKIKSRGKEAHLTHDEIVQTIKWKLARGVFRPRLKDLVQMNTPRVVMNETKKAFRALWKRNDLESAVMALSNLKGVGPAMASAVLAAGAPEVAPFMADEILKSMPEIECIDYTMKEYMKLVEKTNKCVERLNAQGGNWTPHKVELTIWAHYVMRDFKPELLDDMPGKGDVAAPAEARVNGENMVAPAQDVEPPSTNGVDPKESEDSEESGDSKSNTPEPNFQGFQENGNIEASSETVVRSEAPRVDNSPSFGENGLYNLEPPQQNTVAEVTENTVLETPVSAAALPPVNGNAQESDDANVKESVAASAPTPSAPQDTPPAPQDEPANTNEKESLREAAHEHGSSEQQNGTKRPLEEYSTEDRSVNSLPDSKRVREEDKTLTPSIELSGKESTGMSVLLPQEPQVNGVISAQQAPLLTGAE